MLYLGFLCALIISIHNVIIYQKYQGSELFSPLSWPQLPKGWRYNQTCGDTAHSYNCSIVLPKKFSYNLQESSVGFKQWCWVSRNTNKIIHSKAREITGRIIERCNEENLTFW